MLYQNECEEGAQGNKSLPNAHFLRKPSKSFQLCFPPFKWGREFKKKQIHSETSAVNFSLKSPLRFSTLQQTTDLRERTDHYLAAWQEFPGSESPDSELS